MNNSNTFVKYTVFVFLRHRFHYSPPLSPQVMEHTTNHIGGKFHGDTNHGIKELMLLNKIAHCSIR